MSELLNEVKNEVIDIGDNIVKEPIIEEEGNWNEMDTGDLCNMSLIIFKRKILIMRYLMLTIMLKNSQPLIQKSMRF